MTSGAEGAPVTTTRPELHGATGATPCAGVLGATTPCPSPPAPPRPWPETTRRPRSTMHTETNVAPADALSAAEADRERGSCGSGCVAGVRARLPVVRPRHVFPARSAGFRIFPRETPYLAGFHFRWIRRSWYSSVSSHITRVVCRAMRDVARLYQTTDGKWRDSNGLSLARSRANLTRRRGRCGCCSSSLRWHSCVCCSGWLLWRCGAAVGSRKRGRLPRCSPGQSPSLGRVASRHPYRCRLRCQWARRPAQRKGRGWPAT